MKELGHCLFTHPNDKCVFEDTEARNDAVRQGLTGLDEVADNEDAGRKERPTGSCGLAGFLFLEAPDLLGIDSFAYVYHSVYFGDVFNYQESSA
jgi:hypothetical protein